MGRRWRAGPARCAAAVAAVRLSGLATRSPSTSRGVLEIAVDDELEVTMTGPAELIYEGRLSPAMQARLEAL